MKESHNKRQFETFQILFNLSGSYHNIHVIRQALNDTMTSYLGPVSIHVSLVESLTKRGAVPSLSRTEIKSSNVLWKHNSNVIEHRICNNNDLH
jgi:hypothetical protein